MNREHDELHRPALQPDSDGQTKGAKASACAHRNDPRAAFRVRTAKRDPPKGERSGGPPLASPPGREDPLPLVPARMLNEYAYCPRLAYLEWVQGEFAHSADTLDGAYKHRRVDKPGGRVPEGAKGHGDATAAAGKSKGKGRAEKGGKVQDETSSGDGQEGEWTEDIPIHARSVEMSAPVLGMIAVLDLLEGENPAPDTPLTPVDYKRGKVPDLPESAWEPDRVQLCAQGLILRENGYRTEGGIVYYAASKTRVPVAFDEALCTRTRELLASLRETAAAGTIPPPLAGSPKCPRCSLVPICLPDEVGLLAQMGEAGPASTGMDDKKEGRSAGAETAALERGVGDAEAARDEPVVPLSAPPEPPPRRARGGVETDERVRRLVPARADTRPLYVQEQGASIGRKGDRLQVRAPLGITLVEAKLMELCHVCVFGNVQVTTQALSALFDRQLPVVYFSSGGWFRGLAMGLPGKNIEARRRQFAAAADTGVCLDLARRFTAGKLANQRTLLRRNAASPPRLVLEQMKRMVNQAREAGSIAELLGIEGNGARLYFSALPGLLKPREGGDEGDGFRFDFSGRNRRPPVDPVNALLSYAYALLAKELTVTCWTVGLDPFLGFYHQPRFGRPALALDLMEEFRPIVADSVVFTAINTGVVGPGDFLRRGPAVALTSPGRKRFIQAYERRMDALVTHPVFGYQLSYRRVLEVQVRLLARVLGGELPAYPAFVVR